MKLTPRFWIIALSALVVTIVAIFAIVLTRGSQIATTPLGFSGSAAGLCIGVDAKVTRVTPENCRGGEWYADSPLGVALALEAYGGVQEPATPAPATPSAEPAAPTVSQDPDFIGPPSQVATPKYICNLPDGTSEAIRAEGSDRQRRNSFVRQCSRDRGGSITYEE
jgi:hypothetical protein